MWRYPFINFCFVAAVLIFVAGRHSNHLAAPAAYDETVNADRARGYLSGSAPRAPANLNRAAAFVGDVWHRGMAIKEWLMESKTSEWELFNAASPAENDLLEARFHVANAAVFTEAMRDSKRAVEELFRAETALEAARTVVKAGLVPQLSTIRDEIAAAEMTEKSAEASSHVPFEAIKTDLDRAIERQRLSKA